MDNENRSARPPLPGAPPEGNATRLRLTSWKQIGQFFQRDVSTVQRWEKEEGLPVHRHLHRRQSSVYAFPDELETWWQERGSQMAVAEDRAPSPPRGPAEKRTGRRGWILGAAAALLVVSAAGLWQAGVLGRGRSSAAFPAVVFEGGRTEGGLMAVAAADFDGNGITDLALAADSAREAYLVFGKEKLPAGGKFPESADTTISVSCNCSVGIVQAGDFNGDGVADLVLLTTLGEPDLYTGTGKSYLVLGRREWPRHLRLPEDADTVFYRDLPTDTRQGACLFNPSQHVDLNGDGIADLLLGSIEDGNSERRSAGAIYVLFGRREWPREMESARAADVTILGSRTGEGLSGCAAGDMDGDGRQELLAMAPEHTLWNLLGGRGRAYLFLGRGRWPRRLDAAGDHHRVLVQPHKGHKLRGMALADVNGDGRDDVLAVVQRGENRALELRLWQRPLEAEAGQAEWTTDSADAVVTILGRSPEYSLGSLDAADFNADGRQDLVLTQPTGGMWLLLGRGEWPPRGSIEELGAIPLLEAGNEDINFCAARGDFDGDGLLETVLTSPAATAGGVKGAGRAWILSPFVALRVDVRPDKEPNILYYPAGVLVVRVYGDPGSPAAAVDPESVRVAGGASNRHVVRDFDGDGAPDLQLYFDTTPMKVTPETRRVTVTARRADGRLAGGSDSVLVYPSRSQPAPAGVTPAAAKPGAPRQ